MQRSHRLGALVVTLLIVAAPSHSRAAANDAPLTNATVDQLVQMLSGAATKSLRAPRPMPDAATSLCTPPTGAGGSASYGRNLVAYADDTASRVNLALQFGLNSTALHATDRSQLDVLAAALRRPELVDASFAVAGHTDITGKTEANLKLSCGRALAARQYLIKQGVSAERLSAYGFGSNRLISGTEPDNPVHRRVEIRRAPG